MRKILVGALSIVCIAGVSFAGDDVLSQNAVGYVKVTMDKGTFDLLRYDFLDIDGGATTVTEVIGEQVPTGSRFIGWDASSQSFTSATLTENMMTGVKSWSGSAAAESVVPGVGFFLQVPADAAEESYDVFMLGEVPGDNNDSGTTTVALAAGGFSLTGYPYPATVNWADTTLAAAAATGDRLIMWRAGTQGYEAGSLSVNMMTGARSWGALDDEALDPGEGFFFENGSSGAISWEETKPYAWP